MQDIMWELKERPDSWLKANIHWRRADDRMSVRKALFITGHNLRNQLETRQGTGKMGDNADKGDKGDWVEGGSDVGEDNYSDNSDKSKDNNNNNNNNFRNINIKDNNNDNNNNNSNNNNNNNNGDDGSNDHDSSRANNNNNNDSSGAKSDVRASEIIINMMGEMSCADVGGTGADNNNNNYNYNNNNNDDNNDVHGSSGAKSSVCASEIIISMMREMSQAVVMGIGVDTKKWFTIFPPSNLDMGLILGDWQRIGIG
ncbi:hypothetical protein CBR_g55872 [Chara braunii]|uniref:Uncharacterized protein n=1 Tax=Chara braunii TaxID=69332 RepID=A0A388MD99_CHABU|nr:hypothetical protein CBR_g55872 [Chara braunii]|eukprot:GBG92537.1 hypothetical protein CBR_g55872 [Chara braunii]